MMIFRFDSWSVSSAGNRKTNASMRWLLCEGEDHPRSFLVVESLSFSSTNLFVIIRKNWIVRCSAVTRPATCSCIWFLWYDDKVNRRWAMSWTKRPLPFGSLPCRSRQLWWIFVLVSHWSKPSSLLKHQLRWLPCSHMWTILWMRRIKWKSLRFYWWPVRLLLGRRMP